MRFMLFAGGIKLAQAAEAAGVERIVVDLERRDKRARQHGYHLECGAETIEDLRRMRRAVKTELVCRVNPVHAGTPREIESVLKAGADVIMLPMFRLREEVEMFLRAVGRRARTSLLFETREALELALQLDAGSFDEAYAGLNDLSLSCGLPFCYQLLSEGHIDRLRAALPGKPFGFGGATVIDGGSPVPTRQIIAELARLRCTDVILRRAFKRDILSRNMAVEIARLRAYQGRCLKRTPQAASADNRRFQESVSEVLDLAPPGR